MSFKGMIASLNSGSISVPAGNDVMGAWTALYTPPVELCGFYLQVVTSSVGNGFGVFNLGFGSGTPSIIPIQYGFFDGGFEGFVYIPLKCPAGVPIQIQLNEFNGTTDGAMVTLIGKQAGAIDSCSIIQTLGSSATSEALSIGSGWTQLGTTLALKAKSITLITGNMAATVTLNNLTVGIGPSSTAITNIIENIETSSNFAYCSYTMNFDVDLPPSQGIWINGNGGTNSRAMMYVGY